MLIQRNHAERKNNETIEKLTATVNQTTRLIRQIANKRRGMSESDLCQLIQAFVLSRLVYTLPYLHLYHMEKIKIECLISQAYKTALSLPHNTPTDRLLAL